MEHRFVDLDGGQGLLGQAEARTTATVVGWLSERGQAFREAVQCVVIDPAASYRAASGCGHRPLRGVAGHGIFSWLVASPVVPVEASHSVRNLSTRARKACRSVRKQNMCPPRNTCICDPVMLT